MRLSRNEIEAALVEDEMTMSTAVAAPRKEPRKLIAVVEDEASRRAHTWINFTPAPPLSDEQLAALRTEASRLGRPLTGAEAKIVLGPIAGSTATRVVCGPDDNGVIVGT